MMVRSPGIAVIEAHYEKKKKNSSNDKAYSRNGDWRFAWTIARREIRGSLVNFKAFLGALILGVAAIGTVGSVAEAMRAGIKDNARILLGGDIELSSIHQPPSDEILTEAKNYGKLSRVVQMRAMLEANGIRKLVELKAVDQNWPLVGEAKISPDHSTAQALAKFGVIADDTILKSLGLQLGDRATLGDPKVKVGGKLLSEPDRSISFVSFGPRLLISDKTLMATGLLQPGSFITYRFRLLLDNPQDRSFVLEKLNKKTSSTHVRVREVVGAAPGFNRFINQTEMFMVLVALTALLIGGLGVAGAVRAFLITRMQVIATLKCLGATSGLIFRIYLAQVLMITSVGLFVGTIVAVIAPLFAINELSQYVTVPMSLTIYPLPLTIAVSFDCLLLWFLLSGHSPRQRKFAQVICSEVLSEYPQVDQRYIISF